MPSRPAKIKDITGAEGVHVLNQAIREITGRIDDIQKRLPPHTFLKSASTLVFGANIPANSTKSVKVLIPGATTSGAAHASPAQGIATPAGLTWSAQVTAANIVTVILANSTTGSINLTNPWKWNVMVIQ